MNDTPQSSPPQRPRPASARPDQRRVKVRGPQSLSKESRFVGYLVLGFGLLAVISVLFLAFSGGDTQEASSLDKTAGQTPVAAQEVLPRDLVSKELRETKTEKKPQPSNNDLLFERTPNFKAGNMEGDWQASIGRYTAVLQIRKDVFQIILASSDPAAPRYYSSGTFKLVEDIIMLSPRQDWPPPASSGNARVAYRKLTRAPFPVIARYQGDVMLWQNAPAAEKRVSGPYTSPLFLSENVRVAHWKKIK